MLHAASLDLAGQGSMASPIEPIVVESSEPPSLGWSLDPRSGATYFRQEP